MLRFLETYFSKFFSSILVKIKNELLQSNRSQLDDLSIKQTNGRTKETTKKTTKSLTKQKKEIQENKT